MGKRAAISLPKARPADAKCLRRRAIDAANAVEAQCLGAREVRGKRAQEDGRLLERIRSKKRVIEAWTDMQKCGATPEQEQQVVKAMLDARAHAEVLRQHAADRETKKRLLGLKKKAAALHDHFLRRQETFHRRVEMLRSLDRAQRLLTDEIEGLEKEIRSVTRELQTSPGRRVLFMIKLSRAMVDIFKKPLNAVVAALTDVALEWPGEPTTADEVAQARKRDEERRRRVYSAQKKALE